MKIFALVLASVVCACAAPFEIKEGDRVLLLGDALLERENTYGLLETRMHEQFPNVKFTVRNLSWSGETPKGWSRASFDKPEKGWERLKEQIAEVKPTVAILGFGMAASLQEMTDRSGDMTLNPDPVRYGAEPMSAARFKKELGELMDAINERTPDKQPARFVLLSPIKHEDLRSSRPGAPDPAPHNALLEQYAKGIEELSRERSTAFVKCALPTMEDPYSPGTPIPLTENGIHLNLRGYVHLADYVVSPALGWNKPAITIPGNTPPRFRDMAEDVTAKARMKQMWLVRDEVLKKNDLFFHQFRPANSTYLFGFRKHEQGKNAAEMPKFTPLIEAADAKIDRLKRSKADASLPEKLDRIRAITVPEAPADPNAILTVGVGPRYAFRGQDHATIESLKKALDEAAAGGMEKIVIRGEKDVPFREFVAILDVLREAGISQPFLEAKRVDAPRTALPLPNFTVADGLEITLWADTNLVGKPVGMNWDAQGRLWVACSPVYPQIAPGAHPEDKVVVIEDTDRDGKADKSTTFATDLLIAAGVAPDFGSASSGANTAARKASAQGESRAVDKLDTLDRVDTLDGDKASKKSNESTPSNVSISAAYVGASTELVRVEDTDGDGVADQRRIVLSGFGTEDTHHTIHTLRWGPDGRLYFNQSIYIHSHMETPYGMVRLNSGGICAYDPRTERVEVFARGFINTWGHAWDKWGQSFATDGAGFEGLHWVIPGAMYRTYEGARRILPSISPGSYPKYSGLEIIQSPLFPDDWQGNAITCDFRAHKLARFQINDLSQPTEAGKEPLSGYITKELPNPVATTDTSFRPIDVKLGPDGALYIADWTNPIINHGEVDFRDPRRDHVNGRIWRVAPKGKAALKWTNLVEAKSEHLIAQLDSKSEWAISHARNLLTQRIFPREEGRSKAQQEKDGALHDATLVPLDDWIRHYEGSDPQLDGWRQLQGHWINHSKVGDSGTVVGLFTSKVPQARAYAARILESVAVFESGIKKSGGPVDVANAAVRDPNPRVRVEAMRALAAIGGRWPEKYVPLILEAALNVPGGAAKQVRSEDKGTNQFNQPTFADTADPYYGYAAWLSVNDLAPQVMEWIEREATAANTKDGASGSAGAAPAVAGVPPGTPNADTADTGDGNAARNAKNAKNAKDGTDPTDRTDAGVAMGATRDAKIAFALQCLRPEQSSALLSKILQQRGLPRDGSGPWIELIGQAGGPAELRLVLDGLLGNTVPDGDNMDPLADKSLAFTNPDANRRAAAALVAAAKRGVNPANPPYGGWQFHLYPPEEARNDVIRLAGLWKQDVSPIIVAQITQDAPPERLDAIFESLRALATEKTATTLTAFLQPQLRKKIDDQMLNFGLDNNSPAIRRRALATLASFRPDIALAALRGVLEESGSDVGLWRELFSSERFNNALLKKVPALTKEQAAPALRAARELGKRGEKLVAALTPLAGEAPVAPIPQDVTHFVENTKKNGNPVEGELVYRRAALTCTVCHAIGGAGGKVGPDLGTIGASAPLDYIIESTVNPAAKVKEGFHAVAITTKDGKTLSGTVAKETDTTLTLRDMTGGEQAVEKANIKEQTNIGSLMPAGLVNALNHREQANLFAFMAQLGKPGPFDASKASIARTWRVYPGDQIESIVSGKPDPAKGVPVYSLVDGRVTKELMEMPVAAAGNQPTLAAVARFALVNGGKHRLHLAGITKAWLNGAPLAIASDPNPVVDLPAGEHTLVVKLDTATLPEHFRAECPDGRFLME